MLENETGLAEETAQAMRELASTVTDAPPLKLSSRPVTRASRTSRTSRLAAEAAGGSGECRWPLPSR